MKGYIVEAGYMGYVDGRYILFANEDDVRVGNEPTSGI